MKHIGSVSDFYKSIQFSGEEGSKAHVALLLRNWLNEIFDFDPKSGQALSLDMDKFLCRTSKYRRELSNFDTDTTLMGMPKDRVYRIVDHVDEAIFAILRQMRTNVIREYPVMPLHAVREIDSKTMVWLSKKPGRNVREKLNGRPYLKAVKRRNSVDTSENRLFKSFITDLSIILRGREKVFGIEVDTLCNKVLTAAHNWLKSERALDISPWKNHQPNNVLLNDLNYRKIWDAWIWSQRLNQLLSDDSKRQNEDVLFFLLADLISTLVETGQLRIVQQPIRIVSQDLNLLPISQINGYLLDALPPNRNTGTISILRPKGMFGYVNTDLNSKIYFHASYLSDSGIFKLLKVGDRVSFVSGSDKQGECAEKIACIPAEEPKEVNFTLKEDQFSIRLKRTKITVYSELDGFSIQYSSDKKRQKLDYSIISFNKCTDVIYKKITGKAVGGLKYSPESKELFPIHSEYSIIDLYSIRPQYSADGGVKKNLPFRLLMQYWINGVDGHVAVDCSHAKAIKMHPDVQSISMRSLFSKIEISSHEFKNKATTTLIEKISEYLLAENLYYLIPDGINDFDYKNIRKQINYYYNNSLPIPKSIATILDWQSSDKFDVDKIRENDFVLVIDILDNGISITPVKGLYNEELEEIIPKTRGFYWERHPTQVFHNKEFADTLNRNLSQDGCPYPKELFNLWGYDGLVGDAGSLSVVEEETWYHLHLSNKELLPSDPAVTAFLKEVVNQSVEDIIKLNMSAGVYLLPLHTLLTKVRTRKQAHWLDPFLSIINGAEKLLLWQKEAGDLVLWKDHLPNLAFDNIPQQITKRFFWWGKFYLVRDTTLIPQRGKKISIPVKEHFTLPAGKTHYRFPLLQGEGSHELEFIAYLKSPAFPLRENVTCKLHMTYTYGADDPYELRFVPLNPYIAGFKSVTVEWRSADTFQPVDLSTLPVPSFPPRKAWVDFERFPKKDSTEFHDLLDWCTSKLKNLKNLDKVVTVNIEQEFKKIVNRRKVGQLEWGAHDREGKYCCQVNIEGEKVVCRSHQFIEVPDENTLYEKCSVYLDIDTDRKELYCYNVSFTENIPIQLDTKYHDQITSRIDREIHRVEKEVFSLRFPILTIWNNGHSLSDSGIPHGFKSPVRNGIQVALTILKSENYPDSLKGELFFFLSCLHRDAPIYIGKRLLEIMNDKKDLKYFYRNVAFAIGDAELPWQKELLDSSFYLINSDRFIQSISLEILAIAFWRSLGLISKLTENQIENINSNLIVVLNFGAELLISDIPEHRMQYHLDKGLSEDEAVECEKGYRVATLCKHLELLLALLRTRDSKDKRIRNMLAPCRAITKQYVSLIDRISRMFVDNDIEFISRITLRIEKPEMFHNVPDLLYALRMYLAGDSGANTIIITDITDE